MARLLNFSLDLTESEYVFSEHGSHRTGHIARCGNQPGEYVPGLQLKGHAMASDVAFSVNKACFFDIVTLLPSAWTVDTVAV